MGSFWRARRSRSALAIALVVAAVATGGVWWSLGVIALVPLILGACSTCARSGDETRNETVAARDEAERQSVEP